MRNHGSAAHRDPTAVTGRIKARLFCWAIALALFFTMSGAAAEHPESELR